MTTEPAAQPPTVDGRRSSVELTPMQADLRDRRQRLGEQFPVIPIAFGAGGRRAHLMGPLGAELVLGSFVVIEVRDGPLLVAQVQGTRLAERSLGQVETPLDLGPRPGADAGAAPTHQAIQVVPTMRFVDGDLFLVGTLVDGRFERDVPTEGLEESLYRAATPAETATIRAGLSARAARCTVGSAVGAHRVPAELDAKGFSRHTFLCGQSGSGKTYATGVLLERLRLATALPMIVFDPNSDHVHLGGLRDDAADQDDAATYRSIAGDVLVARARGREGDGPMLSLHFSELGAAEQTQLLGLDPVDDLDAYAAFLRATESLAMPYEISDVAAAATALGTPAGATLATRIDNLGIAGWGVWCRPGEASLVGSAPLQSPCLVLDLGSLALPAERTLVATATLRWLWSRRDDKRPVLLVVDEAHNVFPAKPATPIEAAATALGVSLAAEGRKYGLHLLLATQRPSKVHEQVVSQCDNLVLLRVNAQTDVDDLCEAFSHVPPGLIRQAPQFALGELLFAGPISETPLRAQIGRRLSPEGGGDLPADWARSPASGRTGT